MDAEKPERARGQDEGEDRRQPPPDVGEKAAHPLHEELMEARDVKGPKEGDVEDGDGRHGEKGGDDGGNGVVEVAIGTARVELEPPEPPAAPEVE